MRQAWLVVAFATACGRGSEAPKPPPSSVPPAKPGLRVTYEIDGDAAAAERGASVMQRRLALLGITGARAAAKGTYILVELPPLGDDEALRAKEVAVRTGRLTVRVVDAGAEPMRELFRHTAEDPAAQPLGVATVLDSWSHPSDGRDFTDAYLKAQDRETAMTTQEARKIGCLHADVPARDGQVMCRMTGRQVIERYVVETQLPIPDDHMLVYERVPPRTWRTHYVERPDHFAGVTITAADARDEDIGGPSTWITLDAAGARAFGELTAAHVGDKLTFAVDDRVLSAPVIMGAIGGGKLSLPARTLRDAEDLAIVLASGPLPSAVREHSVEEL